MSDGMSDDQIERVFGALSRIETKVDGTLTWMTKHVADDKLMADDIKVLQLNHAKQKGALTVLGTVGSMLGVGVGYLIERWTIGHH